MTPAQCTHAECGLRNRFRGKLYVLIHGWHVLFRYEGVDVSAMVMIAGDQQLVPDPATALNIDRIPFSMQPESLSIDLGQGRPGSCTRWNPNTQN
jgi:hypothetical protein